MSYEYPKEISKIFEKQPFKRWEAIEDESEKLNAINKYARAVHLLAKLFAFQQVQYSKERIPNLFMISEFEIEELIAIVKEGYFELTDSHKFGILDYIWYFKKNSSPIYDDADNFLSGKKLNNRPTEIDKEILKTEISIPKFIKNKTIETDSAIFKKLESAGLLNLKYLIESECKDMIKALVEVSHYDKYRYYEVVASIVEATKTSKKEIKEALKQALAFCSINQCPNISSDFQPKFEDILKLFKEVTGEELFSYVNEKVQKGMIDEYFSQSEDSYFLFDELLKGFISNFSKENKIYAFKKALETFNIPPVERNKKPIIDNIISVLGMNFDELKKEMETNKEYLVQELFECIVNYHGTKEYYCSGLTSFEKPEQLFEKNKFPKDIIQEVINRVFQTEKIVNKEKRIALSTINLINIYDLEITKQNLSDFKLGDSEFLDHFVERGEIDISENGDPVIADLYYKKAGYKSIEKRLERKDYITAENIVNVMNRFKTEKTKIEKIESIIKTRDDIKVENVISVDMSLYGNLYQGITTPSSAVLTLRKALEDDGKNIRYAAEVMGCHFKEVLEVASESAERDNDEAAKALCADYEREMEANEEIKRTSEKNAQLFSKGAFVKEE